jgi:hypothetical protein
MTFFSRFQWNSPSAWGDPVLTSLGQVGWRRSRAAIPDDPEHSGVWLIGSPGHPAMVPDKKNGGAFGTAEV